MIEVRSLTRRYGSLTAVDGVDFAIGGSEIVGLLGHNGAGKTTIMKMLSGYLEPSAGDIRIGGIDIGEDPRAVQRQLGYLPENLPIYPEMMVGDYLEYAATLKGINRASRMEAIREAVQDTNLVDRVTHRIDTLSRGMKQRLGVAQAILGHPQTLIMDEPTNGLDPQQTEQMRTLVRRHSRRATVILSTHIMQEVEALCDRVLVLRNGKLVLDERLDTIRDGRALALRTCNANESLAKYLIQLPQVEQLEQQPDGDCVRYALTLREHTDPDTAANNIAQCVLQSGSRLYQLQPVIRDLDAVFKAANTDDATPVGAPDGD